jgi:uncharacterized protein (TIGR03067 family)
MLAAVAAGLLIAGNAVRAEEKKDDAKKLEGTWAATAMEFGGQQAPADAVKDTKLTFAGDQLTFTSKGKDEKATFKVDTGKKPFTIDITPSDGPDKGKTMKGIYTLDGDTLKIAFGVKEDERPTGFTNEKDKPIVVMTFKREKK